MPRNGRAGIKCANFTETQKMENEDKVRRERVERNFEVSLTSKPKSNILSTNVTDTRRKGRGIAKRPCLNRNALMARENRQRKKAYLEKIESTLSFYQQENKDLANTVRTQGDDIKRLSGEVAYLRSVLNNGTSITALLETLNESLKKAVHSRQKQELANNNHAWKQGLQRYEDHTYPRTKETASKDNSNVDTDICCFDKKCSNCSPVLKMTTCMQLNEHQACTDVQYNADKSKNSFNKEFWNLADMNVRDPKHDLTCNNYNGNEYLTELKSIDENERTTVRDSDKIDTEFDQLPQFDIDMFEDISKCDDIMSLDDNLYSMPFNEEDLIQNLNDTGICLHINSNKVSLEFCSICRSNGVGMEAD